MGCRSARRELSLLEEQYRDLKDQVRAQPVLWKGSFSYQVTVSKYREMLQNFVETDGFLRNNGEIMVSQVNAKKNTTVLDARNASMRYKAFSVL